MALTGLLTAVFWGLVWQLPWIAGLVITLLLYRRWRTSRVMLIALALGLLVIWNLTASLVPAAVIWPLVEPGPDLFTVGLAFGFLDNIISLVLVISLAAAFFRLIKDLAGQA